MKNVFIVRVDGNIKEVYSNANMAAAFVSTAYLKLANAGLELNMYALCARIAESVKRHGEWCNREGSILVTRHEVMRGE